jgi:hypothetical protein
MGDEAFVSKTTWQETRDVLGMTLPRGLSSDKDADRLSVLNLSSKGSMYVHITMSEGSTLSLEGE